MKRAAPTTLEQSVIPEPKIDVPTDINELNAYLNWVDTLPVINHDGIKSYNNQKKILSKFSVARVLNRFAEGKYWDNYYDGLLHISVKIDNYYDKKGNFVVEGDTAYTSLYQTLDLKGFNLYRDKVVLPENVRSFALWIVLLLVLLVILAMIIAIILMTWKRKKYK